MYKCDNVEARRRAAVQAEATKAMQGVSMDSSAMFQSSSGKNILSSSYTYIMMDWMWVLQKLRFLRFVPDGHELTWILNTPPFRKAFQPKRFCGHLRINYFHFCAISLLLSNRK